MMRSLQHGRENHEDHSQVDQTRFPDIRRDELGRRLDGGEEQGQIASRGGTEAELVSEDMAVGRGESMSTRAMTPGLWGRTE